MMTNKVDAARHLIATEGPDGFTRAFERLDRTMGGSEQTSASSLQWWGGAVLSLAERLTDWNNQRLGFMGSAYAAGPDGIHE